MCAEYATRPREQIAQILRSERRYLSAAEVFQALQRARARVSLSTVYRTLDRLRAKGEASSRIDEQGEATYVICTTSHHHHAICRVCGHVEEVACDPMERFTEALKAYHGFELDAHAMEFVGRCARCR